MRLAAALLALLASTSQAHEVEHRIVVAEAVVITLAYSDGQPFAYESYALYPAGHEKPIKLGNTDAHGRITFVPDAFEHWRVRVSSADGHGVNLEFTAPAVADVPAQATPAQATPAQITPALPRWMLAAFGLSLLFGLFGVFQLVIRKR